MAPVVDLERLVPIFSGLDLGQPVALTQLEGGSALVYRVDRHLAEPVILKIHDDVSQQRPAKETFAAGLLSGIDIPITRFLAFDESRTRLPFRFAVTNYLPGVTVGSLGHEPDIADLYRQMGGLLRKMHQVSLPAFGPFDARGIVDPVASNTEFIMRLWGAVLDRFRHFGASPALADRLDTIVTTHIGLTVPTSGPVFAHDDFHPNNVLAQRGDDARLALTGLIDFGNARAADATFDLAKTLFCCEHEAPGSSVAILEGYGPIAHPEPEAALWLYTLIHRVTMWYWLRQIGVIPDGQRHDLVIDLEAMAEQKRQ